MADKSTPSFLDIAQFSNAPASLVPPKVDKLEVKKASVEEAEAAKMISSASVGEMHELATARLEGNDLAFTPIARDLRGLTRDQFTYKYGQAATQTAYDRFHGTVTDVRRLKERESTYGEIAQDATMTTARTVANLAGGLANAASYVVFGPVDEKNPGILDKAHMATSKAIADSLNWVNKKTTENSSDLYQQRQYQGSVEARLDAQDNETRYQRDLADGKGPVEAWLGKAWRSGSETVDRYMDDPILLRDLGVNAAASLVPQIGISRAIGKAGAVEAALSKGLISSADDAAAFFATAAGKNFLTTRAAAAVPLVSGAMEGGSSGVQARQEVMGMSFADLADNPEYRELLGQNMSPEDARDLLAQRANDLALPTGGVIGGLAGKIGARFEAAPLEILTKGGIGSALKEGSKTVLKEMGEEFIQEGGNQLGANIGLKYGAGENVALDRDVIENATAGALAGGMLAGGLQTPGVVAGTVKETARAALNGASRSLERLERKLEEEGTGGPEAAVEAGKAMTTGVEALKASVAEAAAARNATEEGNTTPSQTTANQTTTSPEEAISQKLDRVAYVTQEERDYYATIYPEIGEAVKANPDAPLAREAVVRGAGKAVLDPETDPNQKVQSALTVLMNLDNMRKASSDEILDAVNQTADDSLARQTVETVSKSAKIFESSPEVLASKKLVAEMKPEEVDSLIGPFVGQFDSLNAAGKADVTQMVEIAARVNPTSVKPEYLEKVRNKIDPDSVSPVVRASLDASIELAQQTATAQTAKADLAAQTEAEIAQLPPEQAAKENAIKAKTQEDVSFEVNLSENGPLPSLAVHRRLIGEAAASGKAIEAQEHMEALRRFGVSMTNKIAALNQSVVNGGRGVNVPYDAFNRQGQAFTVKKGVGVKLDSPTSRAFAQEAWIDAKAVASTYNALLRAYGSSMNLPLDEVPELVIPDLDPRVLQYGQQATEAVSVPEATQPTNIPPVAEAQAQDGVPQADPGASAVADAAADRGTEETASKVPEIGPRRLGGMSDAALEQDEDSAAVYEDVRAQAVKIAGDAINYPAVTADEALTEEVGNVASVLELLGVEIPEGTLSKIPTGREMVRSQERLMRIYEAVKQDPARIEEFREELKTIAPWARKTAASAERSERASKSAAKYGSSNPNANLLLQGIEEMNEVLTEVARRVGSKTETLEIQKRALKTLRFGPKTVIKDDKSEFFGMTNMEAYIASKTTKPKGTTPPQTTPTAKPLSKSERGYNGLKALLLNTTAFVNRFLLAFKPKPDASGLLDQYDPAGYLLENLDALKGLDGNGMDFELSYEQSKELTRLLSKDMPRWTQAFRESFLKALQNKFPEARKTTSLNWLRDITKPINGYENFMPANFLMEDPENENELTLAEPVLQAAFMSVVQWMMTYDSKVKRDLDDEEIAKRLGLPRDTRITDIMRKGANSGDIAQAAYSSMTATLTRLLGVEPDKMASTTFTQGILSSMVTNAVNVLESEGFIWTARTKISGDEKIEDKENDRYVHALNLGNNARAKKITEAFRVVPDIFTRAFMKDGEKLRYVGKPPSQVYQKLIRQGFSKISLKQERVIKRLQKVVWRVNQPMVKALELVNPNFLVEMLGYIPLTDENRKDFNKNDIRSIEGKNLSLKSALEGVQGYLDEVDAIAKETGLSREEVAIYFDYRFSSVGRLQQQGPITPQGDKIMRELITATQAVLDLEKNQTHQRAFWLTVAQNLGIKIDRQRIDESIKEAEEMVSGPLAPIVLMLRDAASDNKPLSAEDQAAFKAAVEASGKGFTMKMFHALQTVAQFQTAQEQGGEALSQFKTSLSFEADGVTDGPVNAMVHMKTGRIDEDYITNLARGGWFFTDKPWTIQDQKGLDKTDLYTKAAQVFDKLMTRTLAEVDPSAQKRAMAMLRVMDAFLADFKMVDYSAPDLSKVEIKSERGLLKNPLTVFIYGSSIDGIAGKLMSIMEESIYKTMTEIQQSGKSWKEHPVFKGREGLAEAMSTLFDVNMEQLLKNPAKFTLSPEMVKYGQISVNEMFAEPMSKAIDEVTGYLASNMRLTQQASQIQTRIFQQLFDDRVKVRREEMVKEGKLFGRQLLPEDEIYKIFRELLKVAPVYDTDDMEFYISGKSTWSSDTPISKDFAGRRQANADLLSPSEASVKVSPYLTIGTGDGQMVLTIYADGSSRLDQTLPVFDGIEIGIDNIFEASKEINASVFKGWMDSNPFQSVADGFEQMLRNISFKDLSPDTIQSIRGTLRLGKKDELSMANLFGKLSELKDKALDVEARKAAMRRLNSYTDHMGGAGSPHLNKGAPVTGMSPREIVDVLEKFRKEELSKLSEEQKGEPVASRQKIKARLGKLAEPVSGYPGVLSFGLDGLKMLVSKEMGATPDQIALAQMVLSNPAMKYFQFYQGTAKELTRLKADWYPQLGSEQIQEGQTAVFTEVVFLTKADPETTLHEAIHAWVSKAVQTYYADPASVPDYIKDSIKRLEALKKQFLALDPMRFPKGKVRDAMEVARSEITNPHHDAAEQMDEFLAYALSSQELMGILDKQKVHQNVLAQITNKVVRLLQRMLGIKEQPGKTMLSNVRFNAMVLSSFRPERVPVQADLETEKLLNKIDPEEARLGGIEHRFMGKLMTHFDAMREASPAGVERESTLDAIAASLARSKQAAEKMSQNGFPMSDRATGVFAAVHAAMFSGMQLDTTALSRTADLYDHVVKNLTKEALLQAAGVDPAQATLDETRLAEHRLKLLTGQLGARTDKQNNTDLLASFFALAQVDEDVRALLAQIPAPKAVDVGMGSADDAVSSISTSIYEKLVDLSLSRKSQPKSVQGQLDLLGHVLSETKSESRLMATLGKFDALNKAEDFIAGSLRQGVNKVTDALVKRSELSTSRYAAGGFGAMAMVTSLFSKDRSFAAADALTSMMNKAKGLESTRALLRDLVGSTKDTKKLHAILRKVRASVDAARQDYREQVPQELARGFKKRLTKSQWEHLYKGLGMADMLVFGRDKAMEFFKDPSQMVFEEAGLQIKLKELGGKNAKLYQKKIEALARYMVTRDVISNSLALNAWSIAKLNGEPRAVAGEVSEELIEVIDKLVSLKAYELLDQPVKDSLANLAQSEEEGLGRVVGYHATTRALEYQKIDGDNTEDENRAIARNNGLKGYVPHSDMEGHKVIVADSLDHKRLSLTGWKRLERYTGDANDDYLGERYYYISATAGRNAFRQGAAQTVHSLWNGADIRTGLVHSSDIGGAILGTEAQVILKKRDRYGVSHELPPGEHAIPVFDKDGKIMSFMLPIKSEVSSRVKSDRNLARMLGVWSGRIIEENMSDELNRNLVHFLYDTWKDQGHLPSKEGEWVNVADPRNPDPVVRDAWRTMGWKIKDDAFEIFGKKNTLMVRKDMMDDAIGYRAAGITDAWTGISRLPAGMRKAIRDGATLIGGKKAYPVLRQIEGGVQDVVSFAKTNIIVRSIGLAVGNYASNQLHLTMVHKINPFTALAKSREKFIELSTYVRNKEQIMSLSVDLAAVANDPVKADRIKARMKVLEDVNAKLSIMPLIEANEFGTISESLTEADLEIREGRLAEYIEKLVNKLPEKAVGVVKTAVATKDSELFKVLNRSVQYGDFIAKATLYDHLTQKKGMSKEAALEIIAEEFVDYNRLPGRGRDFLESMGLVWFFNYTLRITKIHLRALRDNPVTMLLMTAGAIPTLGIDTVATSSLPGKFFGTGMDYKFGPEMGIDGLFIHPWNSLIP